MRFLDQTIRPRPNIEQKIAIADRTADQPTQAIVQGTQDIVRIVGPMASDGGAGFPWTIVLEQANSLLRRVVVRRHSGAIVDNEVRL